jgi:hypothetical protein
MKYWKAPPEYNPGSLEAAMVSAYRRAVNASNAQDVKAAVDRKLEGNDLRKRGVEHVQIHAQSFNKRCPAGGLAVEVGGMVVMGSPADLGVWLPRPRVR